MSAGAKLSWFVRSALGSMVRAPFVHLIAVASLGLALVGYGAARIVGGQLDALSASLGSDVEFTVYLADGAEPAQVEELERALVQRSGGQVRRVSPAEALGRLAKQLGDRGGALEAIGENPLPWTLEVQLPPGARDPVSLEALAARLRGLPLVTGVDYGEQALERLALISRGLRLAGVVVFSLVFLTAIIIVSATLQLAIFSRREEIEIQKLVGATDRFVRAPFLIEGLVQGLVAGLLAVAIVFGLARWLEAERGQLGVLLTADGRLAVNWLRLAAEQLGAGVALGLLGSFVAVRRFLSV
jgi:cell division transport system permease protein